MMYIYRYHCAPPPPKKRGPGAELMGACLASLWPACVVSVRVFGRVFGGWLPLCRLRLCVCVRGAAGCSFLPLMMKLVLSYPSLPPSLVVVVLLICCRSDYLGLPLPFLHVTTTTITQTTPNSAGDCPGGGRAGRLLQMPGAAAGIYLYDDV